MQLPLMPPIAPMLSRAVEELPIGADLFYEPKWDGFRGIVFRDGDEVEIGSRKERPLTRYFPELVDALRDKLPTRCVVDGEIVIATDRGLDFEALQMRLHPADSRVRKLAASTPASFVAFDLLAVGDDDLTPLPFAERRQALEGALAGDGPPVLVTPVTSEVGVALDWFTRFEGAGLDGVMAKPGHLPYRPNERVMFKVKHRRTADCVVAGFRRHRRDDGIGSLLLGLFDDEGMLHHVGVASSFTAKRRAELVAELAPYRDNALDGHPWRDWAEAATPASGGRMPGGVSRWNAGKDLSWEPVRLELVAEVGFEQLQNQRFRHSARLLRWRVDRDPVSCTFDQLDVAIPYELREVFALRG